MGFYEVGKIGGMEKRILRNCQFNQKGNMACNETPLHDGEVLYRTSQKMDKHDFNLCLSKLEKRGIYPSITVKFE